MSSCTGLPASASFGSCWAALEDLSTRSCCVRRATDERNERNERIVVLQCTPDHLPGSGVSFVTKGRERSRSHAGVRIVKHRLDRVQLRGVAGPDVSNAVVSSLR